MRFVKSLMVTGLGLGSLLVLPAGCVTNESSLFVEHALLLDAGSECVFDTDLPSYTSGRMDIGIRYGGYGLAISLVNQLQSLGDPDLLRTETSYIRLEGAEVAIEPITGGTSVPAFTLPLTDTIPPGSGSGAGRSVSFLKLVPSDAIDETGTYLIHVTMFGHTLGGTPIETGEFVWPLEACDGCLSVCEPVVPPCEFQYGGDYFHHCSYYDSGPGTCENRCPPEEEATAP
jgi:hypothetical protein